MAEYTLHYFDIRGLGEGIRLIMKHAGVAFTDHRIKFDEWPTHKASMPMGQLPVLEGKAGQKLSQSTAIAHFLGEKHGLLPADLCERAKALELVCAFADNGSKVALIMANKEDKAAAKKAYDDAMSSFVMPRLKIYDEHLKASKSGFLTSAVCWADFMVYNYFCAFKHFYEADLAAFPAVSAFVAKMEALPTVKDYIASQKGVMFSPMCATSFIK